MPKKPTSKSPRTRIRAVGGWHSPKRGGGRGARELYLISFSCHIDSWDEYVIVKDRAELDAFMREQGWKEGVGCEVIRLIYKREWACLDTLWMTR